MYQSQLKRMFLIQILLPLNDNHGKPLPKRLFRYVNSQLTDRFKGLTIYSRAPAEGLWKPAKGARRDQIVVYEVMAARIEVRWWKRYRCELEMAFRQENVVIRAQQIVQL